MQKNQGFSNPCPWHTLGSPVGEPRGSAIGIEKKQLKINNQHTLPLPVTGRHFNLDCTDAETSNFDSENVAISWFQVQVTANIIFLFFGHRVPR